MKENSSEYKALETISVLAFACLVFGLLLKIKVLLYIAGILLFIGIFLKGISKKIANIWLKFSHLIGTINTRIILTIVFFLVLTPLAFLYRLFHGDFMYIKKNNKGKSSYWKIKDHKYKPGDFEKPW